MSSAAARQAWSLEQWLGWQETLHPKAIDLGLERVRQVADRMEIDPGAARVVTIAGTNGKGSCAAALQALLRASGAAVGCYTSPHLQRYNERILINGEAASDLSLCEAFALIDERRGEISLSYFEFGTLAALWLMQAAKLDFWVLEVGLGGRLDAVNIIDADVAIVTSIGLDHCDWLGSDRDSIAVEKLGVARAGRPLLIGDESPPPRLLEAAAQRGAIATRIGVDWTYQPSPTGHLYCGQFGSLDLATPSWLRPSNLLCALQALSLLAVLPEMQTILAVVAALRLPGRCEQRSRWGRAEIHDVAHNTEAAQQLAAFLQTHFAGQRISALFWAREDKPIEAMTAQLSALVSHWHVTAPAGSRPESAQACAARIRLAKVNCHADIATALAAAHRESDCVVVWGSFLTVAMAQQFDG